MAQPENRSTLRTITLEEHFATPTFLKALPAQHANNTALIEQLCDIGDGRIAAMDAAGIDVQVLSLTSPGAQSFDATESIAVAREANERLAEAVQHYPSRFAGFAALPTATPDIAANELERTIRDYGFKGALINGHTQGRYLDDEFFWPILERADALQVPIYLHPTPPPQPVIATYYTGNFAPELVPLLMTGAWGWHIETATHILRLVLSGVFDRYPNLQFVIGHMGEALPFMLPRIETTLPLEATKLKRPIGAYFRENLYYTFAGFNWTQTFLDLLLQVGVDRIMFSADHPYRSMEEARTFLEHLPVSPADKERIAHGNAERLLHM
jgi:predicted TIM-barrel fold metal-dependent hydrolase